MKTVRDHLVYPNLGNLFKKGLLNLSAILLFLISNCFSAKMGNELTSTVKEVNITENQEIQNQGDSVSHKTLIYLSSGVTTFNMSQVNSMVEIVIVEKPSQEKKQLERIKKRSNLALQSLKKEQQTKKYSNKVPKTFYSNPTSDSEVFFSKNSLVGFASSPTHDFIVNMGRSNSYFLQIKQYDKIFINYKSAFFSLHFHKSFSVRPPPIFI